MIKKIFIILFVFVSIFWLSNYRETKGIQVYAYYETSNLDPVADNNKGLYNSIKEHGSWIIGNEFKYKHDSISWYIQKVLAYFLWITAVLAVFVLLYGAVGIFSPKSEEWLQKSMKYIKWATIALLAIALSWLFVMLIFYVYKQAM